MTDDRAIQLAKKRKAQEKAAGLDSLNVARRSELLKFLQANPGTHFRGISNNPLMRVWFSRSQLEKHLVAMGRQGLLRSEQDGRKVCYFVDKQPRVRPPETPEEKAIRERSVSKAFAHPGIQQIRAFHQARETLLRKLLRCPGWKRKRTLANFGWSDEAQFVYMVRNELVMDDWLRTETEIDANDAGEISDQRPILIGWLRLLRKERGEEVGRAPDLRSPMLAGESKALHGGHLPPENTWKFSHPNDVMDLVIRLNATFHGGSA